MPREALSSGDVVAVFPEGTTTDGTTLLRFHASLLQPIVESQGHVQPVAIALSRRARRAFDGARVRRRDVRELVLARVRRASPGRRSDRGAADSRRGELHRRELARAGRRRYPNGFGGYRLARRHLEHAPVRQAAPPVSGPPHRQPESSISTFGVERQLERRPVAADDERCARCGARRASNQGRNPCGRMRAAALLAELHRDRRPCRSAAACRR